MTRDLLVRGIDDEIHLLLSETATKQRVSLNSIVKDAIDKWVSNRDIIPKRHDMILYSDSNSIKSLQNRLNDNSYAKHVCFFDFKYENIMQTKSLQDVIIQEKKYNTQRTKKIKYCPYKLEYLLSLRIESLIELFEEHDQVYILKNDELYKLHLSKESIHKLFLN